MNTQFDTKLKELNINHYSMPDGQLERLQAFIDEFSTHEDFKTNQSTFIYLRADALANTRRHAEAIEAFTQLYKDEIYIFPTLIAQRIAEQLLVLNREDEALSLIDEALNNETRPVDRLYLLYFALSNLDDPDAKLQKYSSQIEEISQHSGIEIPAKNETFSAKITYLRNERNKASRRYREMMMKKFNLPKSEQIAALEHYIEKEMISEFKTLAEEALQLLHAINER